VSIGSRYVKNKCEWLVRDDVDSAVILRKNVFPIKTEPYVGDLRPEALRESALQYQARKYFRAVIVVKIYDGLLPRDETALVGRRGAIYTCSSQSPSVFDNFPETMLGGRRGSDQVGEPVPGFSVQLSEAVPKIRSRLGGKTGPSQGK